MVSPAPALKIGLELARLVPVANSPYPGESECDADKEECTMCKNTLLKKNVLFKGERLLGF